MPAMPMVPAMPRVPVVTIVIVSVVWMSRTYVHANICLRLDRCQRSESECGQSKKDESFHMCFLKLDEMEPFLMEL
jgi:hypothetical protein